MNAASHGSDRPCFTNFALQEYALGRLNGDVRLEVEAHVGECRQCAALIEKETRLLKAALRAGAEEGEGQAPEREMLAMYLDDSLDQETREKCESLLASSSEALAALLSMRRELVSVLNVEALPGEMTSRPEGRILRMPKRRILPKTIAELYGDESEAAEA